MLHSHTPLVTVGALRGATQEDLTRLATLSVVSSCLSAEISTGALLRSVLECLLPAFQADRGLITLFDSSGSPGCQQFLDSTALDKEAAFALTTTLLDQCVEKGEPILVIDAAEEAPSHSVTIGGIRSVMLTPLTLNGVVLGAIYLDCVLQQGSFEFNDLKLCGVIAEMVSVAVDRNRQLELVEHQSGQLEEANAALDRAAEETIHRLSRAAEFRDGETSEHLTRVAQYCEALGQQIGLEPELTRQIKVASLLHDVGKLGIPDSIMLKPGRFTDYERQVMQQHTLYGARILQDSPNEIMELAAAIALRHHEKWDGSGYPEGLAGEAIPLPARLVAVADVFDAVSSARRYKHSYSLEDSFELLRREAGSHFDPALVEAFLAIRERIEAIWNENQGPQESRPSAQGAPEREVAAPAETNGSAQGPQASLVTIIDSDPYQREILSTEATRRGLRVTEHPYLSPGEVATMAVPDAVILEIADPEGELLLPALRQRFPQLPILVLSRDGDFARRLTVAGYDGVSFLHKPFPPPAVLDELEERLPKRESPISRRVVALDDDPVVLTVISRVLERAGYRVVTTRDPIRFWEALIGEPPDLVLLDLEMPTLSGYEVCRVLRNDVKYRHLPIIVLTAHQELEEYRKALEAGADDVLGKPLQADRLLTRIQSRMMRNRALRISGERDPVSGLIRRRLALRACEQLFAISMRQSVPFSLCALEIDQVQNLVAEKGWLQTATLFREMTELLVRSHRVEDVLTRYDEFTLLMGLFGIDEAGVKQRIASLNNRLVQHTGPLGTLRCVGRIATAPVDGGDLGSLLAKIGLSAG